MYSEKEFRTLMNMKKLDPIWKKIYYIQSMVKQTANLDQVVHVEYDFEHDKNTEIYQNAFDYMNLLKM